MKNVILLFFIPLCLISCVHTAQESVPPTPLQEKTQAHAQKIIDACWAISEEDRANPDFGIIDRGHYATAQCLEDHYIKLFLIKDSYYLKKQKSEIRNQFQNLRKIYTDLYIDIIDIPSFFESGYTSNSANTEYSLLLENILSDLIYEIHRTDDKKALKHLESFTP